MASDIILDSHSFNTDTSLLAQWEGAGVQVLPSGRKLYRHESNQGSVIEFDYWGSPMKLFVADAKYRGLNLDYDAMTSGHGIKQISVTTDHFDEFIDDDTEPLSYTKNDAWIQSTYADLRNDGTAASNSNRLIRYSATQAAHHCRNQDIPGVGQLDLPNLYELIILYLESDNIDALDPTAESNRDKALGMMNTRGRFDFNIGYLWSSTENNSTRGQLVYCAGYATYGLSQHNGDGVAPVKELDA